MILRNLNEAKSELYNIIFDQYVEADSKLVNGARLSTPKDLGNNKVAVPVSMNYYTGRIDLTAVIEGDSSMYYFQIVATANGEQVYKSSGNYHKMDVNDISSMIDDMNDAIKKIDDAAEKLDSILWKEKAASGTLWSLLNQNFNHRVNDAIDDLHKVLWKIVY